MLGQDERTPNDADLDRRELATDGRVLALPYSREAVAFWQRTIAPSAGTEPLLLAWRDDRTLLLVTEHSVTAWTIAPLGSRPA